MSMVAPNGVVDIPFVTNYHSLTVPLHGGQ